MLGGVPSAHVVRAKQAEGCQEVEDEDGGPADEEHQHDQDQHVDNLQNICEVILFTRKWQL